MVILKVKQKMEFEQKVILKEAFFFGHEKTTLDQIGWGPL